jgi:hypothetical protein
MFCNKMKRLLLLLFIVVFMSFIYTLTLVRESFEEAPDPIQDHGQVCFTPNKDRLPIYTAIRRLSDDISVINLRLDSQGSQLSILTEQHTDNQRDLNEASTTRDEAHQQAKEHVVGGVANGVPPVHGASQSEVHQTVNDHYSKPVKQSDLDNFSENIPPTSNQDIKQRNMDSADHYDKPQRQAVNAGDTSNSYMDKNKAKCICAGNQSKGDSIVNDADTYGFKLHKGHTQAGCKKPPDDCNKPENKNKPICTCCRVTAGNFLKNQCTKAGCKPVNPMGTYPSAAKEVGKSTSKATTSDHSHKLVLAHSKDNT